MQLQRGEPLSRSHGCFYDPVRQAGHTLNTSDSQGRLWLFAVSASLVPAPMAAAGGAQQMVFELCSMAEIKRDRAIQK